MKEINVTDTQGNQFVKIIGSIISKEGGIIVTANTFSKKAEKISVFLFFKYFSSHMSVSLTFL